MINPQLTYHKIYWWGKTQLKLVSGYLKVDQNSQSTLFLGIQSHGATSTSTMEKNISFSRGSANFNCIIKLNMVLFFFLWLSNRQDTRFHQNQISPCSVHPLMKLISALKFVALNSPIPSDWLLHRPPPVDPWCDVLTKLAGVLS